MVSESVLDRVPAKIPRIAVYLPEEVKAKLEKLAQAERRSLSQMAALLIEQGLSKPDKEDEIKQLVTQKGSHEPNNG